MKKIAITLTLLFALILVSCSEESIETLDSSQNLKQATDIKTNIGTYKGVFTTIDSEFRGTVEIEIINFDNTSLAESFHRATIQLQTGDVIFATSKDRITSNYSVDQVKFKSKDISFNFSVNGDGSNPTISNAIYNNTTSDVIIAKHTLRAPVTAVSGTYNCLGCNVEEKTFSFVITNDGIGNQTYTTQVNFNGVTYSAGTGYQNNCLADSDEPTLTFCNSFSGEDGVSEVGFLIGGDASKPITWEGELTYNNEAANSNDCTTIIGNWFFRKGETDEKSGVFTSDTVDFGDNCLTFLVFEGFGGATQLYTTSVPEFTDGSEDYFIRTNGDDIANAMIFNDIVGEYFFAAHDIDGEGDALPVFLTFENLDISSLNTIYFSAEFSEDDDGSNQDWDVGDYVHVDYSFDGGTTWVTFFALENDGSTFNSAPFIDTNLDGTGDGQEITNTFENFRSTFANDGSTNPTASTTVSIRIAFNLNSGDEDIAIDNVLIRGL